MKTKINKVLSIILASLMIITSFPFQAFANTQPVVLEGAELEKFLNNNSQKQNKNGEGKGVLNKFKELLLPIKAEALTTSYSLGTGITGVFDDITGVFTISGTGAMANYSSNNQPYYSIKDSIKSVVIEDGVTSIGKYAFYYNFNNLETVTIADTVTIIEDNAFANCNKLTSIVIPNSVTKIGGGAFANCQNLSKVTIGSSVATISVSAFYDCRNLAEIINLYKGKQIIDNSNYASFKNAGINVPIAERIAKGYFENYDFIRYVVSNSQYKFNELSNIGVYQLGDNVIGTLNSETGLLTISGTGAMTNFNNSNDSPYYYIGDKIKSVVIEDGVTSIGKYAFYYNFNNLETVTIADTVLTIEDNAFAHCNSLISIVIPNSVTKIGGGAFANCQNLSMVTIGSSVATIGMNAFFDCRNLAEIINLYKGKQIIDNSNYASFKNAGINVPIAERIVKGYFENYDFIRYVVSNSQYKFNELSNIGVYQLGTNVIGTLNSETGLLTISGTGTMTNFNNSNDSPYYYIGDKIKSIVIEDGVTSIGKYAFYYNFNNLETVTIADTVLIIEDNAFGYCNKLISIVIPNSVTKIGGGAFLNCQNLSKVTIGSSVATIGVSAFYDCRNLAEIINLYKGKQIVDNSNYASFKNAGINVPIAERIAKGYFENYDFIRYVVSNSQYKFSELSNIGVYQLGTNVIGTFDSETGLLTISGTGAMTNFNNSNDSPYYYIGDKIKSVVIEEGVTSIGKYAFYYNFNNLETVTIADTVLTIEDNAFAYCNKLISIVIPNSVTKIGGGAFANCQNLSMVTIGSSVASIGVSAFYDCRNLAEIINLYKGNQTIDISSYASFYNAGYNINPKYATADLVNTNFINAITSRGYKVNETANWGNFVLGTNVAGTFNAETGVLTISGTGNMTNFSGNNAPYNFIKYKITSVVIEEGVTSIGNYAFNGLFILTSITIPNSVTSIGDYAFNGCVKLSSVVLPANLTNLGGNAFNNCDSLSTINIPNSLTTIRYNTFYDCDNLTSVNIPNSVTNIGEYAFYSCDNLAEITNLYKGNQIIDRYAFTGAGSNVLTKQANSFLENYNFNNAITSAGYILNGVETVGTYKLGTNVTGTLDITTGILTISGTGNMNDYNSINQPFYPVRDKIKTVIIEEGVTNVGNNTFYAFKNLTSITIANTVKIIRSSAFYDCDGLTTIVFPNSLTSIEYSAFKECDNITSITIPGSVTTIGSDAFSECDNLVEIINEYTGNQTIGTNVFTNSGLNKPSKNARGYYENINFVNAIINAGYTFEGLLNIGVYQLGTNVIGTFDAETGILTISGTGDMTDFLGINTPYYSIGNLIKTVIIQEGVTSIGDNAFYNNFINLTSIIIPETVTKIGSNAFYKSGIASIIIPNSVLTISSSAFNECDGLISITIPSSVVTIGSGAFANCDNLAEIINMYQGNQSIVNVFTNSGKNASTKIGKAYFENLNGIKSFINAGYTFEELSNIGVYQLGVNVIGTLDSDTGIFTISGTGNMNDMVFNFDNRVTNAPYFEIKEKIKHVIVETGVTRVGKFAFYECDNILTVSFAETVISIGGGAFFSNDKLEEINFSEGLTTIDNAHVEVYSIWECNGICWSSKYQAFYGAFRDSKSLTSVTFPSSLSNIGSYAFGGAVNLASINNLYNGEQTVETSAFVDAGKSLTEKTATVYTINTTFSSYIEGIGYTLNLLEYQDVIDPVINLSANITALTNQNVIVTALVTDNEEIAVKKWAKGLQNAEYFMSSGNELQETFTVSENGTYSIYAKDTNENVTIKTITINNIDKILPTAPTIKIILGKLVITHGTDSGSGVNDSKYQINDGEWTIYVGQVALVDGEYIINAKTTDKVGNESSIATSNTVIYETALNNAKNAVSQAETTKEQIDIDNARTLVNVLPETELIKSSLIERLDMVQKYINNKDTLAEATNAVALAKITKLQDDIDNAFALVNSLSDSIEKTYLLEQLNNVQRYIDIKKALEELINNLKNRVVPFANIASLKIEMPMYLTSSVNIKTFMINKLPLATIVDIDVLLNSLPEGEDKAYLKALNSLVNNSNDFITQILIGDMVIAETTINTINADVVNLPEGEDKVTFIEIAHELTLIFNAMKLDTVEAIAELPNTELKNEIIVDKIQDAITIAEETNNQEDVNEANEWINILPDSHESKETLTQEIEVIQEIVDIKEQIQEVIRAIEQAEETKLPEDINKAQELISNLPDNQYTETIKPSLEERVNTIPVDYLALAIQAVEKAERTHIQTDLDYARILVNNLLDNIIEKISLNERLDILQIYINKVKIATQSVKKAEMSKLQTDVDNARIYVNELIEPEITDLGKRLDAVQIYIYYKIEVLPQDIDTINGFLDVINLLLIENYEQAQVKLNEVKIIIETIIDIDSKSQMTLNAQRLQNVINAGNSIILAENTLMQNDYNIANASVGSLPDTKFKVNLLTRLNNLQAIINAENELQQAIANTTNAVVKAEGSKLQADVNSARALVNALPQIAEKTSLTERLNAVQSMIDIENELQQAIANATNAVVKAEGSKLQTDVDSARVLVNGLPNSEVKTSLNGRLDTVQAIIDAEKELQQIIANATNAVIKAEGSKLQADVDNARALVNALSNSEKKTSLTERLNSIQVIVDNPGSGETNTAEAIKNAETKVKIAEAYKRNPYLTDAEEVVNALYDSPKKTALLDRLEALKEKIEENAIAQELKNATTKVKIAETYKREPYISTARDTVNALIDSPEKEALDDRLDAIVPIDGSGSSSTVIKYANNAVLRAEKTPTKYTILYAIKRVNMIADGTPEKADLLQRVETLKTNYNNLIAEKNAIRQINNATNYVNYAEKYKSTYYFNKAEALVNALENGEIKTTLLNRLEVLRPIIFPSAEAVAIQEATKAVEKAEKYKIEVYIQNARTLVNALADSEIKTTLSDRLDLIIVE